MARVPRTLEIVKQPVGWARNPNVADGSTPPGWVENVVLVAGASQQVTVPTGAQYACFTSNVDFYAAYGTNPTAAVPATSTTDGSGNEMNPINRFLGNAEVAKIAVISAFSGILTISFWGA